MKSIVHILAFALLLSISTAVSAQPAFEPAGPYLRHTVEGDVLKLDVATRILVPIDGNGPTVTLVGAIHVGDPGFYALLQRLMDGHDLVLFEGVGEPAGPDGQVVEPGSDADKARVTGRRLKGLALLCLAYQEQNARWPESIDQLLAADSGLSEIQRRRGRSAHVDAWGRPVSLTVADVNDLPVGVLLTSHGSDGEPGGQGHAADQSVSTDQVIDELDGVIHVRLANILGLVFQGQHILTDQPHWRNSDMAWDDIEAALQERGSPVGEMLGQLLGGDDPMVAQMLQGFENLATASPMINTMFKLMLITQLSEPGAIGDQLDPAMQAVIIDLRNQHVIDDLKAILGGDDTPETIAVFYGAGHLEDMEQRLFEQLGYRVAGVMWFNAIALDLTQQGLSENELNIVRQQVKRWGEEE